MDAPRDWSRFLEHFCHAPEINLTLDISRMRFDGGFLERMRPAINDAFAAMEALEGGAIANPDEERMVGHYWLRAPDRAPHEDLRIMIRRAVEQVRQFAAEVHAGNVKPPNAPRFTRALCIGIGGSSLGPMFVHDALRDSATDKLELHFIDNTDPDGIDRELSRLRAHLGETLVIVTSKSGGTPETRNGMLTAMHAFQQAGLDFSRHAVAITAVGSKLDRQAESESWLATFPMWDWVGGRTSETSAVGLLPAALQGADIDALLRGAAECDEVTRSHNTMHNPAALMALMWHYATDARGARDLVVLPYKDRLLLFSRYLQQLIMESLGKQLSLTGERVDQGLTVYGNKGSTDQHAYVQQLRDGVNNFFVTFVRVLEVGTDSVEVEPHVTSGDYLHAFALGTREALSANERESMTITIPRVDAYYVGVLIALFERTVGYYASLIGINAYHQPGVEAGKKAASGALELQRRVQEALSDVPQTAEEVAGKVDASHEVEVVFLLLEHLAANDRARSSDDVTPTQRKFTALGNGPTDR